MVNGIIAIIIAYLLGSIPSAYIITRLKTGKDIRKLDGGNVGARNVFHEVGLGAAIAVVVFDVGKGAAAVAIARLLLDAPDFFVLGAGLAAVVGHIWSIYLKFTGGNGIATTIGVLAVLMTRELLIALAITLLLVASTRNPVLSVNISLLLSVPISAGFLRDPWLPYVVFSIVLALILVLHFLPTAMAAFAKAGSKEKFATELLRMDEAKKSGKKSKRKK
jgi:glycerol-3-phosphate acyltransferase PlsY